MTQRVNIIATEQATPTTAGAASSISKATCVRLYNQTGGDVVVNVSATVSAASTNQFTMAAGRTEFLEKLLILKFLYKVFISSIFSNDWLVPIF